MTGSFMALLSRPCVPRLRRRSAPQRGALHAPPGRLRRPGTLVPNTENAPIFGCVRTSQATHLRNDLPS